MKKKEKKTKALAEVREDVPKINLSKAAGKQIKYGSMATVLTVLFLAAVILLNVAVNIAAQRVNLKADLTKEQLFTLGDQTKQLLSEMESDGADAELIVLGDEQTFRDKATASSSVTAYRFVVETTDNYQNTCPNISVHYVDPAYNPAFFNSRGIVLDDGTDTESYGKPLIVVYSAQTRRYRILRDKIFEDMRYVGLERRLTGALLFATTQNLQTVALLTGHGEAEASYFGSLMEDNGFSVVTMNITEHDAVPDEVQILVINNPQREYSAEDIRKIDDFLNNGELLGKHLMVFGDIDMPENPKLESYLANEWGLHFGTDSILDTPKNVYTLTDVYYPFLKLNYAESEISAELAANKYYPYVRLGKARTVYREYDAIDNITTMALLKSFDTSFSRPLSETNMSSTDFQQIEKTDEDTKGPFEVMAISHKSRFSGTDEFDSTVLISGSTSFLDDYFLGNVDGFTQTSADYMLKLAKYQVSTTEDIELNILPKALMGDVLKFDNNYQLTAVILGLTVLLPLVFVVAGIIVYRRRKYL